MDDSADQEWKRRHIDAFRNHRGHAACTVQGCIGSQPLMWVPTESEAREISTLEADVADLARRAEAALTAFARRQRSVPTLHVGMTRPDGTTPMHLHW